MLAHLAIALCLFQGEDDARTAAAKVLHDRAFAEIEVGRKVAGDGKQQAMERALADFRTIVADYQDTRFYGLSHYNVGYLLCHELQRYEEAIAELEALIASKVDDRDSSGALMHPHRNYRYNALHLIATCNEHLERPGRAIAAVFRARTAYVADCGTCERQMRKSTRRRLLELSRTIAPHVTGEDVDSALQPAGAAASTDPGPAQFLMVIHKRLDRRGDEGDSRKLLRVLATDYASSPEGKAAAKALARGPRFAAGG